MEIPPHLRGTATLVDQQTGVVLYAPDGEAGPIETVTAEVGRKRGKAATALPWPCVVPMPPSANNMFLNVRGRGRVPSVLYRKWRKLVIPMMAKYRQPLAYPVEIELIVRQKMRGRTDLDNRIKPTLDCLVSSGVLRDDDIRHVKRVEIRYEPKADGDGVDVWIRG